MTPRIIEECRKKMYEAVWMEIDRDPQRPATARVDIKTNAGNICIWCDITGNTAVVTVVQLLHRGQNPFPFLLGNIAVVTHKTSNNDSERLEEAIEGCLNYQDVMDDWLEENSQYAVREQDPMDAFEESRLDSLMARLI